MEDSEESKYKQMKQIEESNKKLPSHLRTMVELAGIVGFNILLYQLRKPDKPLKNCGLPECEKLTNHNGGYCCADHCREHRIILKAEPLI